MTHYNADINETGKRDGTFHVALREFSVQTVTRDPEYDLCAAMVQLGLADAPIQFWRDGIPTLRFASVHHTAARRVELGKSYPYRVVRRKEDGENYEIFRSRSHQDCQPVFVGYDASPLPPESNCTEPRQLPGQTTNSIPSSDCPPEPSQCFTSDCSPSTDASSPSECS